jgi:excisionase family DNA binding protein
MNIHELNSNEQELIKPIFSTPAHGVNREIEPLFTPNDVANMLAITEQMVLDMAESGEIAATYFGGDVRFSQDAVEDAIDSHTVPAS